MLTRGFGMHLHKASGDKLEDLGGEPRNELSVGAAMWRVCEQLEHPAMSQTERLRGHVGLPTQPEPVEVTDNLSPEMTYSNDEPLAGDAICNTFSQSNFP